MKVFIFSPLVPPSALYLFTKTLPHELFSDETGSNHPFLLWGRPFAVFNAPSNLP